MRENLDRRLWPQLPTAVTHGDVHPGNLKFENSDVSAIFDFDYLSPQARAHDVVDALAFFASRRGSALEYRRHPLAGAALPARRGDYREFCWADTKKSVASKTSNGKSLPWIIRSLWIQMRLRGSRKVPTEQKAAFVLDRFDEVIDWLDREAADFFASLAKP